MKDYTRKELEASRPDVDGQECINFCLEALFKDKTKRMNDAVCTFKDRKRKGQGWITTTLTYEELIGALLLARDHFEL
jgi:hypothetical protein